MSDASRPRRAFLFAAVTLLLAGCPIDPGPVAPLVPDRTPSLELPISGEERRVVYRVVVAVNQEAAVYETAMIPWGAAVTVVPPTRLLPDDEDAPDSAEVLDLLAIYATPVVDGHPVTASWARANLNPGGLIDLRPMPRHPEPCEPLEPCRREYVVEFDRLATPGGDYRVQWRMRPSIGYEAMGIDEPDGAEIFVDVSRWGGPLPPPPPDLPLPEAEDTTEPTQ